MMVKIVLEKPVKNVDIEKDATFHNIIFAVRRHLLVIGPFRQARRQK